MPAYVPLALLVAFEAAAALVYVIVLPRFQKSSASVRACSRCTRLHARGEAVARVADAAAVGALAYLIALPFVAAGFERALSPLQVALAASAVVAGLAIVAETDFLVRVAGARLWPQLSWGAAPGRILGGGARWFGAVIAIYIFKAAYSRVGVESLFGAAGKRLGAELPSSSTITAAAVLLVAALLAGLLSRWLVPMMFASLPAMLAVRHRSQDTSA